MNKTRHVLISNDDGIDAPGLLALEATIRSMPGFRVTVVAPNDQQSASSSALTLTRPMRIHEHGTGRYSVTGTPTDTVLVAIKKILADDLPDVVLSGINHGANMGEDVIYSGTVAAAMEGTMIGLPSFAISHQSFNPKDFTGATSFIRLYLEKLLAFPLEKGTLLNINIPDRDTKDIKGVRVTKLGNREYHDVITDMSDPHGKPFVWIGGHGPTWIRADGNDHTALDEGYVSITPLLTDLTNYKVLAQMNDLECDGLFDPATKDD